MAAPLSPIGTMGGLPSPDTPAPSTPERQRNTSSLTLSQLSGTYESTETELGSQLSAADIGLPPTPEQRVLPEVSDDLYEAGYDSDGLRALWLEGDKGGEESEIADEASLPDEMPAVIETRPAPNTVSSGRLTVALMEKMKVSELRDALKERGLSTRGKKDELRLRLKNAIESDAPVLADMSAVEAGNVAGDEFDPGSHWQLLEQDGEVIEEELESNGEVFRAPTAPEGEVSTVQKRNYSAIFDRGVFTGQAKLPKRYRRAG